MAGRRSLCPNIYGCRCQVVPAGRTLEAVLTECFHCVSQLAFASKVISFALPRQNIHSLTKFWHTYLTMDTSYNESPSRCSVCQVELTVEHILHHCLSFTNVCEGFVLYLLSQLF